MQINYNPVTNLKKTSFKSQRELKPFIFIPKLNSNILQEQFQREGKKLEELIKIKTLDINENEAELDLVTVNKIIEGQQLKLKKKAIEEHLKKARSIAFRINALSLRLEDPKKRLTTLARLENNIQETLWMPKTDKPLSVDKKQAIIERELGISLKENDFFKEVVQVHKEKERAKRHKSTTGRGCGSSLSLLDTFFYIYPGGLGKENKEILTMYVKLSKAHEKS